MVVWNLLFQWPGSLKQENAWAQEFEAAVSYDHATALQPGWQSEILSVKKNQYFCGFLMLFFWPKQLFKNSVGLI